MLSHAQIWKAIELLAEEKRLSVSGLAKKAGLDPTTFNRSKRVTAQQKLRWPSTESISKILFATNTSMSDFVELLSSYKAMENSNQIGKTKLMRWTQAESNNAFDAAGFPIGRLWKYTPTPLKAASGGFMLLMDTQYSMQLFGGKAILIIDHEQPINNGDRVLAMDLNKILHIGNIKKNSQGDYEINLLFFSKKFCNNISNMIWISRINCVLLMNIDEYCLI